MSINSPCLSALTPRFTIQFIGTPSILDLMRLEVHKPIFIHNISLMNAGKP